MLLIITLPDVTDKPSTVTIKVKVSSRVSVTVSPFTTQSNVAIPSLCILDIFVNDIVLLLLLSTKSTCTDLPSSIFVVNTVNLCGVL